MDWYEQAYERAADEHDPEMFDGREWEELTDEERERAVYDDIDNMADAMEVM